MNGGRQVGGVAEEEHVAVAPAVGQLGPEGVLRDAHQLELVARDALDPRSDERLEGFDGLEVGGGLARRADGTPSGSGSSPMRMYVAARSGSQTWCTPSHWSSSTVLATSITSQRCSNLRSSIVAPIAVRTTLLAPSQPST